MDKILSEALKTGENVGLGEAFGAGLKVTAVGLSIVFGVLIILMIVLMLFKVIFYKEKKENTEIKKSEPVRATPIEPVQANEQKKSTEGSDEELIAVITAAVAACMGTSPESVRIRSYRRIENKKPAWNRAGINDMMNNRF